MHDLASPGGSGLRAGGINSGIVAVGVPTSDARRWEAAGVPTVQEADGVVATGGLGAFVMDDYAPPPHPSVRDSHRGEAIVGSLAPGYPHSVTRVSVIADRLCVTLLPSREVTQVCS